MNVTVFANAKVTLLAVFMNYGRLKLNYWAIKKALGLPKPFYKINLT
jgi:hypothetical protein